MIEDLFARRLLGRDPMRIEAFWRESYGSGFTLRPDLSLVSVMSGLEMACWDIIGKALDQPVYNLLGGQVHERLRSYTYLYPADGEGDEFYHDAERSAQRAAEYVSQGFTALKFDPTGGYSVYDPRQPTQESLGTYRSSGSADPRGRRNSRGPAAGYARSIHHIGSDSPRAGSSKPTIRCGSRSLYRRKCPNRWHIVARGTEHSDRHRRASDHQVRVRPRAARRGGEYLANEPRTRGRTARGEENRRVGRGALRTNCAASVLRSRGGRGQYPNCNVLPEFLDFGGNSTMGRLSRAAS